MPLLQEMFLILNKLQLRRSKVYFILKSRFSRRVYKLHMYFCVAPKGRIACAWFHEAIQFLLGLVEWWSYFWRQDWISFGAGLYTCSFSLPNKHIIEKHRWSDVLSLQLPCSCCVLWKCQRPFLTCWCPNFITQKQCNDWMPFLNFTHSGGSGIKCGQGWKREHSRSLR